MKHHETRFLTEAELEELARPGRPAYMAGADRACLIAQIRAYRALIDDANRVMLDTLKSRGETVTITDITKKGEWDL